MQKNFYLHQSAKEGYRAYLQSYASYSLKKIFDVNKLDLAKVGKAFGFAVPPRVNVNVGIGSGESGSHGQKRARDGEDEDEEMEDGGASRGAGRKEKGGKDQGKARRAEQLGKKQVDKEVFRKEKVQKTDAGGYAVGSIIGSFRRVIPWSRWSGFLGWSEYNSCTALCERTP